jgi:hypothetical protein
VAGTDGSRCNIGQVGRHDYGEPIRAALDSLWADVERARHENEVDPDEYHARNYVRAAFAFLEAYSHYLRYEVAKRLDAVLWAREEYDLHELEPLLEDQVVLRENGTPLKRQRRLATFGLLAYSLRKLAEISNEEREDVPGRLGDLKMAWRVRDRLTHPKVEEDVVLGKDDVALVTSVLEWLRGTVSELLGAFDEMWENAPPVLRQPR